MGSLGSEMYVNSGDRILVFPLAADGNVPPDRVIEGPQTGLNGPNSIVLDQAGFLYVSNAASSAITVYEPGADGDMAPVRTIRGVDTGLMVPAAMAFDEEGLLYVMNTGGLPSNRTVTVYKFGANGNQPPERTILGVNLKESNLSGIAVDRLGQAYLMHWPTPSAITVIKADTAGVAKVTRTIVGDGLDIPGLSVCDADSTLYVANGRNVLIFEPASSTAARTIAGPSTKLDNSRGVAVDTEGTIYVANLSDDLLSDPPRFSVTVYASDANLDTPPIRRIWGDRTTLNMCTAIAVSGRSEPKALPIFPVVVDPWVTIFDKDGTTVQINLLTGETRRIPTPPKPPKGFPSHQQDFLLGIAISQAAAGITENASRATIQRAALKLYHKGLDRIMQLQQAAVLDEFVGQLVSLLPDGTEYRQVIGNPGEGDQHTTPDGRSWTAVREEVVEGNVIATPFTLHWRLAGE
jgi:hypothetical protein